RAPCRGYPAEGSDVAQRVDVTFVGAEDGTRDRPAERRLERARVRGGQHPRREPGSHRLVAAGGEPSFGLVDAQRAAPLEAGPEWRQLRMQLEARDAQC